MGRAKRVLKAVISIVYWVGCRIGDRLRASAGREPRSRCVVLYYHGITEDQRPRFRQQMGLLRSRARVVPLSDLATSSVKGVRTCLTFDDGLDSIRRNAVPILSELDLPASVFVVSGNLGRRPSWPIPPEDPDATEPLMTAEQILTLPRDRIQIGSHTVSHRRLPTLPGRQVRRELRQSKRDLETLLGSKVDALSVPYGEYNADVLREARAAGYGTILTCDPDLTPSDEGAARIGRFKVTPDESMLEFRLKASGAYCWVRHVRKLKRTLAGLRNHWRA
ncbi:MAG: polysaccharide deacetylase family protein [Phycisphaerae bacterium]|nr:polysaccharide deacetylase family protein [Phycisphaerae bacterium]